MNKFLIFSFSVIILSLSLVAVAFAQLEITSPDDKFFVVAKYDFEANNPESFETPYYWWGIYDLEKKEFLPKYFQKDIPPEEALNNNVLEDVVFLEGDKSYWVGVVYCPAFIDNPLNLQEIEANGCSYKIKPIDVNGFEIEGTIVGLAPHDPDPIYGEANPSMWKLKFDGFAPEDLSYNWGVYSYNLDEIINVENYGSASSWYITHLSLGEYIVGSAVCNYPLDIGGEKPLENFDPENCIILTRPFKVVERIHVEPLIFQSGEEVLIKGSIAKSDISKECNKVKVKITRVVGEPIEEITQIELFDDGLHGDGDTGDEVYGNYWDSVDQAPSKYELKVMLFLDDNPLLYSSTSYFYITASTEECLTIHNSGSAGDKLDILFVGENFETVEDLLEVVNGQKEYFIGEYGIEPYKLEKDKINLHASTYLLQDLCECEDEIFQNCNIDISNYFHCPHDKVIYLVKRVGRSYSTFGGTWAVVSLLPLGGSPSDEVNVSRTTVTVHELGHCFGSLRDEYTQYPYIDMPGSPNCADSIDEAIGWWEPEVGKGKGVLQVLSADELNILGIGPITIEEFSELYGYDDYKKCLINYLDECIDTETGQSIKEDFLRIDQNEYYYAPTGQGCSYSHNNFRPTMLSIMRHPAQAFHNLISGTGEFADYYWWNHWHGPVNEAHLETLLEEYS